MMSILYNSGIAVYTLAIRFTAFFNAKAREWVSGRKDWKVKLADAFEDDDNVAWFHAASLGEFEQGRPVIEAFRKIYPDYKIFLTFFSPSGYSQKKDYKGADMIMYLPADCRRNARYFVKTLNPSLAVFIKYEFWYNYLAELNQHQVPTVFISCLVKGKEPFFKWYGGYFRKVLKGVNHFYVQDQMSADRLSMIGIQDTSVSGDTRFDRVSDILNNKQENKDVEAFCQGQKVLLAGSTWPPDEEVLADTLKAFPALKLVIAPHEIKEERIRQLIDTLGIDVARYSTDDPSSWNENQVLIIDTIGLLSSIYRYADIAYIGGAFATGLHNIQEPAVNGMPVIFGPKYDNFREAIELVEQGGAFTIKSSEDLNSILNGLFADTQKYQQAASQSKAYMIENTGATEKIMDGLRSYL